VLITVNNSKPVLFKATEYAKVTAVNSIQFNSSFLFVVAGFGNFVEGKEGSV
jgi:hypothetical protein